jgi:hypothetical protein
MRKVSDKSFRESQNTYFTYHIPPPNIVPFRNVKKYVSAGQATDDNMANALCVLDT